MVHSAGLIPVAEADLGASTPIVVYPFVAAQSLDCWLNSRAQYPSNVRLLQVVKQVLQALHAIHQTGFAHGQIDLDHILITSFDHSVRIVGLSCLETVGNFFRLPRVATHFDAPEIRQGRFEVSSASDIYSVGKVMIELFGRNSVSWPIVQAMTATQVSDRPTSAELLVLLSDLESRLQRSGHSAAQPFCRAA